MSSRRWHPWSNDGPMAPPLSWGMRKGALQGRGFFCWREAEGVRTEVNDKRRSGRDHNVEPSRKEIQ